LKGKNTKLSITREAKKKTKGHRKEDQESPYDPLYGAGQQ
jgi:hypothetical protein